MAVVPPLKEFDVRVMRTSGGGAVVIQELAGAGFRVERGPFDVARRCCCRRLPRQGIRTPSGPT